MSPLLTQPRSAAVQPHLDKAIVAELTPYQISELTSDEMVQVIRTASIPSACEINLRHQGRETLERLVYLARRCCRNQGY